MLLTPDDPPFVCLNPDEYLFRDSFHPTRATHAIIAEQVAALLIGRRGSDTGRTHRAMERRCIPVIHSGGTSGYWPKDVDGRSTAQLFSGPSAGVLPPRSGSWE